ncbi:MAG: aldolase [Candidatus Hydrogenedentota bacterium]
MSYLGKQTRLNRIFSHPSGRVLTVAVDHLCNYAEGLPVGLRDLGGTIDQIVAGTPNAITLNKGAALRFMPKHAGKVPFIVQSMALRPGEDVFVDHATPLEVAAMGADAIAVAMFVKCPQELAYMRHLAAVVRDAEPLGLPVVPHIYPLSSGDEKHAVTHEPEEIFYAVRVGLEMGADIIKVPYTGDVASFRDIVRQTPVPVVTAGGPKCPTLDDAVNMVRDIATSGAAGATMGRNVWGFADIGLALRRLKAAMFDAR